MPQRPIFTAFFVLLSLPAAPSRAEAPAAPPVPSQREAADWLGAYFKKDAALAHVRVIHAGDAVILSGSVGSGEEIDRAFKLARRAGLHQVINAMRIGSVDMIQLDLVLVRLARAELGKDSAVLQKWQDVMPAGALRFGTLDARQRDQFLAVLQELREQEYVKVLAEPHLIAMSGRLAYFNSGGSVPIPQLLDAAGLVVGETTMEYGTTVTSLPKLLPDGRILVEVNFTTTVLDPEAGIQGPDGRTIPGRHSRGHRTSTALEDGQTLVIGNLVETKMDGKTEDEDLLLITATW